MTEPSLAELRSALLRWYRDHQRDLPWRRTADPYRIWISETMLQQTRVSAVIPYYERFLARFPDVASLAAAPEAELLGAWAGLGYYYRARNLQKAAQQITAASGFPTTYEGMAALPGVGPYTAAAVASIAFGHPHAVVDGNVYRVLSRLYNDSTNIASAGARKHFSALADALLDRSEPGAFNQAVMELGATVCLPKRPQCLLCPIARLCRGQREADPALLPVKIRENHSVVEHRQLFWIEQGGQVLAWQRSADERLMAGFWELPERAQQPAAVPRKLVARFRHAITIHDYRCELWEAELPSGFALGCCKWVPAEQLSQVPLSTIFRKALRVRG